MAGPGAGVRVEGADRLPAAGAAAGGEPEHALEGPLEVGVAERVEDGVERRVEVAEPDGGGEERVIDLAVVGHHHEEGEVRHPAEDERAHDDAQLGRRLLLFRQDNVLWTMKKVRLLKFQGHSRTSDPSSNWFIIPRSARNKQ